jgi:uncharacterized protein YeaO (DUF488 family)
MPGKLYTSYIANIKHIPDNIQKIVVTRYLPNSFSCEKERCEYFPDLSPSPSLLYQYKNHNISWITFAWKFQDEMQENLISRGYIGRIAKMLEDGEDVCIICYEKEVEFCHRSILAKIIGYEGGEL